MCWGRSANSSRGACFYGNSQADACRWQDEARRFDQWGSMIENSLSHGRGFGLFLGFDLEGYEYCGKMCYDNGGY